jgi:RNA polymerase sigma-70 factor (ECF subfamily)
MYTLTLTDNELVARYQKYGDSAAMGCLYKRYSPLVFGLCYKYLHRETEAKDAVSEIFLIVLEKARKHDILSFRHWLYAVSRNYLYTCSRYKIARVAEDIEKIPGKFMENPVDLTLYIQEHPWKQLERAMSRLDKDQRTCIELFYMQEKSYKEVALATGFDLSRVKSCIQNGKRKLKIYFEQNQIHYEKRRS